MPKQKLTGTLEQQCEFLYGLAITKIAEGNYTGAKHALEEIVKYKPDFRDSQRLLDEVKTKKSNQSFLVWAAIGGGVLFIAVGSLGGIRNDLALLGLAAVGALTGYGFGNYYRSMRSLRSH